METFLDCLPCLMQQTLDALRRVTEDDEVQAKVMAEAARIISNYQDYRCSPAVMRDVQKYLKEVSGVADPYRAIKDRDLKAAGEVYPYLKSFLERKGPGLYWALKVAATGNIIDSAMGDTSGFRNGLERELEKEFRRCDLSPFEEQLRGAKRLLIIGDNAGETFFDRVLMEQLEGLDISYAVRSEPIINDTTHTEAVASGLDACADIVSTGCGVPGVLLEEASGEFLTLFNEADIVISKGQGNFESLEGCGRPIFFLLKAKCAMVARMMGVDVGDYLFVYQEPK